MNAGTGLVAGLCSGILLSPLTGPVAIFFGALAGLVVGAWFFDARAEAE